MESVEAWGTDLGVPSTAFLLFDRGVQPRGSLLGTPLQLALVAQGGLQGSFLQGILPWEGPEGPIQGSLGTGLQSQIRAAEGNLRSQNR